MLLKFYLYAFIYLYVVFIFLFAKEVSELMATTL